MRWRGVLGLVAAALVAPAMVLPAGAAELTLTFRIDPQISGARPWDGTGVNSPQVDSDGGAGGGLWGPVLDLGKQAGLDQLNQRMAPPDPYICLMLPNGGQAECFRGSALKNTLDARFEIPAAYAGSPSFAVIIADSDDMNVTGGGLAGQRGDDLIGFGVFLNEATLADVRAGDPTARALAQAAEAAVTAEVTRLFGSGRGLFGEAGGTQLLSAKLAVSRCAQGCRIGEAIVTIAGPGDGW